MRTRSLAFLAATAAALCLAPGASASELIDRNAVGVRLQVSKNGGALLTYRTRAGKVKRVLAWGATNAIAPTRSRRQVSFRLDYSGGWGAQRKKVWKTFRNVCGPYRGPALQWMVTACTAPDGSHWAVQSWQRQLPNFGVRPKALQAVWELRLSHWKGPLPEFVIKLDWAYRRFDHLYGWYKYLGQPVYGFKSTRFGAPLDTFGRNVYVDTFNSAYGSGWRRENSFLTHNPGGNFCYGFYPHGRFPIGKGERYRATVIGPGVLPDMYWQADALGPFDSALDVLANEEQKALAAASRDDLCKVN